MNIIKTISILFACFMLLIVNFANAAMPCCMINTENSAKQMSDDTVMPCHDNEVEDQDAADCEGCNCKHCLKIHALSQQKAYITIITSNIKTFSTQSIYSYQPEGLFQPPKYIS